MLDSCASKMRRNLRDPQHLHIKAKILLLPLLSPESPFLKEKKTHKKTQKTKPKQKPKQYFQKTKTKIKQNKENKMYLCIENTLKSQSDKLPDTDYYLTH